MASDKSCVVCGAARGLIYVGPVYAVGDHFDEICPWCIADGTAAAKLGAQFTDVGWGVPNDIPPSVAQEIATRTPSFLAWQQERWLFHCGDGAAFLGRVGYNDLHAFPDALEMLIHENDEYGWTAEQSLAYVRALRADGDATAYLFKCNLCGRHLAYSDMS